MVPLCGVISPASRPISVVLPAPFGPMMAWNSPRGMSSVMASDAVTPPKRRVRPLIRSSGSATARASEQAFDTAAQIKRDKEEAGADEQAGKFGETRQDLFEQQKSRGTDQRAERRGKAAQHHEHHQ